MMEHISFMPKGKMKILQFTLPSISNLYYSYCIVDIVLCQFLLLFFILDNFDFPCLAFDAIFYTLSVILVISVSLAKQTRLACLVYNCLGFRMWIRQVNSSDNGLLITQKLWNLCKSEKENQPKMVFLLCY